MVGSDSAQQLLLAVAELLGVSGVDGDFGGPILDVISGCLSRPSTEKTFIKLLYSHIKRFRRFTKLAGYFTVNCMTLHVKCSCRYDLFRISEFYM